MSLGLKKDTVKLEEHQEAWDIEGANACKKLKGILGDDAVDVQHVGSTSIRWICAKPIIDIAVAVRDFQDIMKHNEELEENGIVYRRQDVPGQHLYRCSELDHDIVTHFIHVVIADSQAWHSARYPEDRNSYVKGKEDLIDDILVKANAWSAEHEDRV